MLVSKKYELIRKVDDLVLWSDNITQEEREVIIECLAKHLNETQIDEIWEGNQ